MADLIPIRETNFEAKNIEENFRRLTEGDLQTRLLVISGNVRLTDGELLCDASDGRIDLVLFNARAARQIPLDIKKIDGTANAVRILAPAGQEIDGDPSVDLVAKDDSVRLKNRFFQWWIF